VWYKGQIICFRKDIEQALAIFSLFLMEGPDILNRFFTMVDAYAKGDLETTPSSELERKDEVKNG
jgi:hypothetical protein